MITIKHEDEEMMEDEDVLDGVLHKDHRLMDNENDFDSQSSPQLINHGEMEVDTFIIILKAPMSEVMHCILYCFIFF